MFDVRPMAHSDAQACVRILNHIIEQGGTTAYEVPMRVEDFASDYVDGCRVRHVARASDRLVGFQAAFDHAPGVFSIATFTDREDPAPGAGRALFVRTVAACRALEGQAILAMITSDNTGGLAYYSRMGFQDYEVIAADHTRRDGTVVDRIVKRLPL